MFSARNFLDGSTSSAPVFFNPAFRLFSFQASFAPLLILELKKRPYRPTVESATLLKASGKPLITSPLCVYRSRQKLPELTLWLAVSASCRVLKGSEIFYNLVYVNERIILTKVD